MLEVSANPMTEPGLSLSLVTFALFYFILFFILLFFMLDLSLELVFFSPHNIEIFKNSGTYLF